MVKVQRRRPPISQCRDQRGQIRIAQRQRRLQVAQPIQQTRRRIGQNRTVLIAAEGRGAVVLLRDTTMKLHAEDIATPRTLRQYGLGAQILSSLGLSRLILLTNSARPRVVGLDAYGLSIEDTRPIPLE